MPFLAPVVGAIGGAIGGLIKSKAAPTIANVAGSVIGSKLASSAANKAADDAQAEAAIHAADLQKQAADEALAFQKQQYGEQVQRMQPWLQAGQAGLTQLQQLGPFQAPGATGLSEDPGYQFRLAEGQKAMERSAAAKGNVLGGGAIKAAERYGQGMASQEYGNVYARRMGEYQQQLNRLENQAGIGQTTGAGLGSLGQTAAGNIGNILQTGASGQGAGIQNAAAARASGYVDTGSIWSNLAKTGGSALGDYLGMRTQGGSGIDPLNIGKLPVRIPGTSNYQYF